MFVKLWTIANALLVLFGWIALIAASPDLSRKFSNCCSVSDTVGTIFNWEVVETSLTASYSLESWLYANVHKDCWLIDGGWVMRNEKNKDGSPKADVFLANMCGYTNDSRHEADCCDTTLVEATLTPGAWHIKDCVTLHC